MQGAGLVLEMVRFEHFGAYIIKYRAIRVLWRKGGAHHLPGLWIGEKVLL